MDTPSNRRHSTGSGRVTAGQLDAMSTAELLEGLERALNSMTEETYDDGLITAYLDALDRKSPMPEHPTADESYEDFKRRVSEVNSALNPQDTEANGPKRTPRKLFRSILVAIIAAACLLSCMVVVQAAGVDVFGSIARWTNDLFGFGDVGGLSTPVPTQTQQPEITVEYIESLLPEVPEGFVMGEPVVFEDPESGVLEYLVNYSQGENYITYSAIESLEDDFSLYEKDSSEVNKYIVGQHEFYIIINNGSPMAAWKIGSLECGIFTNLTIDELTQIILTSYGEE